MTTYQGGALPPPQHDGPCEESLDGDGKPLGYCVVCYQPMPGRVSWALREPVGGRSRTATDQADGAAVRQETK